MSLSEYFRKKSGVILFASTVAVSGFGSYAGLQIVHKTSSAAPTPSVMTTPSVHPSLSALTIAQHTQETLEGKVTEDAQRKKFGVDTARAPAIAEFTRAIERMEQDGEEIASIQKDVERIKARSSNLTRETNVGDIVKEKEVRQAKLENTRQEMGAKFIDDLRLSDNVTEEDYESLVEAFDKKAAVALPETLGNYREGAMYKQECQHAVGASAISMDTDEEVNAADVGACMKDIFDNPQKAHVQREKPAVAAADKSYGMDDVAGAMSGAAIGAALMVPFWLRRRRPGM